MGFLALAVPGLADYPASSVRTQPATSGQAYPTVPAHGTGWFDVGGFCKVVDVGDLSWANPPASAVPVFIPGTAAQWTAWRAGMINAPGRYQGQVTLTTCCPAQSGVATLCAGTANPVQVDRQYGRLGEADPVSASCVGTYGAYTDQVTLGCNGSNAADGQASWQAGGDSLTCSANAQTVYGGCSASCGNGNQLRTVYDSCGRVQSQTYDGPSCNLGDCCTPNYQYVCGGCSSSCGGGTQTCYYHDQNNCSGDYGYSSGSCNTQDCAPASTTYSASCDPIPCGPDGGYACDCDYVPQFGFGPPRSAEAGYLNNKAIWSVYPPWKSNNSTDSASAYTSGGLTPPAGESCGAFQMTLGVVPHQTTKQTCLGPNSDSCWQIQGTITCTP